MAAYSGFAARSIGRWPRWTNRFTVNSPHTAATTIIPVVGVIARSTTRTSPSWMPSSRIDHPSARQKNTLGKPAETAEAKTGNHGPGGSAEASAISTTRSRGKAGGGGERLRGKGPGLSSRRKGWPCDTSFVNVRSGPSCPQLFPVLVVA